MREVEDVESDGQDAHTDRVRERSVPGAGDVEFSRREFLHGGTTLAAGTAVPASTPPVSLVTNTDVPPYVDAHRGLVSVDFPTGDVVQHETGALQWAVEYTGTAYGDWLQDWIASVDGRSEVRHIQHGGGSDADDGGLVVLAAATEDVVPPAVTLPTSNTPLAERDSIPAVEPVRRLTNTNPVSESELLTVDDWEPPGSGLDHVVWGEIPASGSVFSEVGPYTLQDAGSRVNADAVTETGAGVRVGVVDTGLNYNQSLYGQRVVAGKNTITDTEIDPVNDDYSAVADANMHGSWIGTAIAGNGTADTGTGVAPDAELVPVKALGDDGSGQTDDIVAGIEYCAAQDCDVINLSLGTPIEAVPVSNAIRRAVIDGDVSLVVAAAGNSRMSTYYMGQPAAYENTVPVASIDAEPAAEARSAYYSSVAPHPRTTEAMGVAGPGHRVVAAVDDGSSVTNKELSGTSMAAPVVSGVAALVLEADPGSVEGNPIAFRDRLEAAAEPLPKCGVVEVGAGRVDAERAVQGGESESDQEASRDAAAKQRDRISRNIISPGWI